MASFKRKLRALGFPQAEVFDIAQEGHFRSVVVWLEDQKIRLYPIEERAALREVSADAWPQAFAKYLVDLHYPYDDATTRPLVCDWLLNNAIGLAYADNADEYGKYSAAEVEKNRAAQTSAAGLESKNPLDNLNFESDEFKRGASELARLCKVAEHPDHLVTLRAVCTLVKDRLSKTKVDQAAGGTKAAAIEPDANARLEDFHLPTETGDKIMDNALRALRLLHVHQMRELQTGINETIVAVQNLTADPKTDDRLGKVGF